MTTCSRARLPATAARPKLPCGSRCHGGAVNDAPRFSRKCAIDHFENTPTSNIETKSQSCSVGNARLRAVLVHEISCCSHASDVQSVSCDICRDHFAASSLILDRTRVCPHPHNNTILVLRGILRAHCSSTSLTAPSYDIEELPQFRDILSTSTAWRCTVTAKGATMVESSLTQPQDNADEKL